MELICQLVSDGWWVISVQLTGFDNNSNYTVDINNNISLIKYLATAESLCKKLEILLKIMQVMEKMQMTE
jgi:hypothetical protein